MAYSKDLERLVRSFVKQKLDLEYIRHYLMENYQLDRKSTDVILEKVGVKLGGPAGKGTKGKKTRNNKRTDRSIVRRANKRKDSQAA